MGSDFFLVDLILHVISGLIDAQERETVEDSRVNLLSSIRYDTDNHLCRN